MGFLRLLLAILVAQQHLGNFPFTGSIAIFGFFVLSGFLVTMIINKTYNDGMRGKCLFLLNRFLRIYPVYWVCLGLGVLFLTYAPIAGIKIIDHMIIPQSEWWRQFAIFGLLHFDSHPYFQMPLATAWSLNVELVYYLVIGLLCGKSRGMCLLWFIGSLGWFVYALNNVHGEVNNVHNFEQLFYSYAMCSLEFSTGSLMYHYQYLVPKWRLGGRVTLLALTYVMVILPGTMTALRIHWGECHFFSIIGFAYIIPAMYRLEQVVLPSKKEGEFIYHYPVNDLERWCGRISYPFFLLHAPAGAIVSQYWLHRLGHSFQTFIYTVLFTMLISAIIVYAVEMPIEYWRRKIRTKAIKKPQALYANAL